MREVIAKKGQITSVYRLVERDLFIKGVPSPQYYQMLANFKQKEALKSSSTQGGWIKFTFIDSILVEDLNSKFFDTIVKYLKTMGFECRERSS